MLFGLYRAPVTFERVFNSILHNKDRKICLKFLKDINVSGKNKLDHDNNLTQALTKLEKNTTVSYQKINACFEKL